MNEYLMDASSAQTVPLQSRVYISYVHLPVCLLLQPSVAVNTLAAKKPKDKPRNPNFGSGPTSKMPGWKLSALEKGAIGRSHRSALGLKKLKDAIAQSK